MTSDYVGPKLSGDRMIEVVSRRPRDVDYAALLDDVPWLTEAIVAVEDDDDVWTIELPTSHFFSFAKSFGVEPRRGDEVRLYGNGMGCPIRGVVVGSEVVYYESREANRARHRWEVTEKRRAGRMFEGDPIPTSFGACY